jgi:hypothetical protein
MIAPMPITYVLEYVYKLRDQWRWKRKGTLVWTYCATEMGARMAIAKDAGNAPSHVRDITVVPPRSADRKPYRLVVTMAQGHTLTTSESDSPDVVRNAEHCVAHDPKTVQRIEIHDLTGCLEALWDASW